MHVRDVRFLDNDCMLVPSTCDTMKFVALESIRPSEKLDRSKLQMLMSIEFKLERNPR